MVTINDIKLRLNMDLSDTSQDAYIQNEIDLAQAELVDYCNNEELDFSVRSGLDKAVIFIVIREVMPDTRFRAGKQSENTGLSVNYSEGYPVEIRRILTKYRRRNFI